MVEPVRHRRTKGAATDMFEPKATASHLDSTQSGRSCTFPLPAAERTCLAGGLGSQFDPRPTCCLQSPREPNSCPFTIATRVVRSACASRVGRTTATNCLDGKIQ